MNVKNYTKDHLGWYSYFDALKSRVGIEDAPEKLSRHSREDNGLSR